MTKIYIYIIIIQVEEMKSGESNSCACEDIEQSPEMYLNKKSQTPNWCVQRPKPEL